MDWYFIDYQLRSKLKPQRELLYLCVSCVLYCIVALSVYRKKSARRGWKRKGRRLGLAVCLQRLLAASTEATCFSNFANYWVILLKEVFKYCMDMSKLKNIETSIVVFAIIFMACLAYVGSVAPINKHLCSIHPLRETKTRPGPNLWLPHVFSLELSRRWIYALSCLKLAETCWN